MYSRLLMILAGVLAIVSAWLPWVSLLGQSTNGFHGDSGNPGLFFIVMGVIIALMGAINKKWSAIVAILFAFCVVGLGAKYYSDSTSADAVSYGAKVGMGVYCMLIGGVVGIVGGIMKFFTKKQVVVA